MPELEDISQGELDRLRETKYPHAASLLREYGLGMDRRPLPQPQGVGWGGTIEDVVGQGIEGVAQAGLNAVLIPFNIGAKAMQMANPEQAEGLEKARKQIADYMTVRSPAKTQIGAMTGEIAEFLVPGVPATKAAKAVMAARYLSRYPRVGSILGTAGGFAVAEAYTKGPEVTSGEIKVKEYAKEIARSGATGGALGGATLLPAGPVRLFGEYSALTGTVPIFFEQRLPTSEELLYGGVFLAGFKAVDAGIGRLARVRQAGGAKPVEAKPEEAKPAAEILPEEAGVRPPVEGAKPPETAPPAVGVKLPEEAKSSIPTQREISFGGKGRTKEEIRQEVLEESVATGKSPGEVVEEKLRVEDTGQIKGEEVSPPPSALGMEPQPTATESVGATPKVEPIKGYGPESLPQGEGAKLITEKPPTKNGLEKADVVFIPREEIKTKYQPREGLDEPQIKNIVENYDNALYDPLVVNQEGGGYFVISGHHRLEAARRLGIEKVPARVLQVSERDAHKLAAQANENRLEHSALEQGEIYGKAEKEGLSFGEIGRRFNKPEAYVEGRLALNALSEGMKSAFRLNKIPIGHLVEFGRKAKVYGWTAEVQDELFRTLYAPYGREVSSRNFGIMLNTFAPKIEMEQMGLGFKVNKTDLKDKLAKFFNAIKQLEEKQRAYKGLITSTEKLGGKKSGIPEIRAMAGAEDRLVTEIGLLQRQLRDMVIEAGGLSAGGEAYKLVEATPEQVKKLMEEGPERVKISKDKVLDVNWKKMQEDPKLFETVLKALTKEMEPQFEAETPRTTLEAIRKEAAKMGGMRVEELLNTQAGKAFNAVEMQGAINLVGAATKELRRLSELYGRDPAYGEAFRRQAMLSEALVLRYFGVRRVSGQALRVQQEIEFGDIEKVQEEIALTTLDRPSEIAKLTEGELRKFAGRVSALPSERIPSVLAKTAREPSLFFEFWINGLLSNPPTSVVNFMSSVYTLFAGPMERAIAARVPGGRIGVGKAGGELVEYVEPGVAKGEAAAMLWGLWNGIGDAVRVGEKAWRAGQPVSGFAKLEQIEPALTAKRYGLEGTFLGNAVDWLGAIVRTPGRVMMSTDEFFKALNYRMEVQALAFRRVAQEGLTGEAAARKMQAIIDNPPRHIRALAEDYAHWQTFTKDLETTKGVLSFLGRHPFGRIVVPFVRTPVNIFKYTFDRLPGLALLSEGVRADLKAGGARRELAVARMAVGGIFSAIAAGLVASGNITGAGPREKNTRHLWLASGKQPYSIKMGDKWYRYNRVDPMGAFFGLVADFVEISGGMGDAELDEIGMAVVLSLSSNMLNKTYLVGLSNVLEALQNPEGKGAAYVKQFAKSLVPAGVAGVERLVDPTQREVDGVLDAMRERVPGLSEKLPPKLDIFGEVMAFEGSLGPDVISPIYATREKKDPVVDELLRVGVGLSMPQKYILGTRPPGSTLAEERAGQGITLTPEQYYRYGKLAGGNLRRELGKLFVSEGYRGASDGRDGGKALLIKRVVYTLREGAKVRLLEEFPELRAKVEEKGRERAGALAPGFR